MELALISIVVLLILLVVGVPVFLSLGITGLLGIMYLNGVDVGLSVLREKAFWSVAKYAFMVIPLFILMGYTASYAGVTERAFAMAKRWLSAFPGGLAIATTLACAFFGACCGSSVATAAAMGSIAVPEMRKAGYEKKLACGTVAGGALIAMLIPPSIPLVIYGVITETSIGALLIAGIIPGIITTIVFSIGIMALIRVKPQLAPPVQRFSWSERIHSLRWGWQVCVLFIIVIGGIYFGIATPSETAALGTVAALIMLVAKRKGVIKALRMTFSDSLRTSAMIFAIICCATIFAWFLTVVGIPAMTAKVAVGLNVPPIVVVLLALAVYLPLGMFLDPTSCMLITLPILHPIIVGKLGFSSVWFGILVEKMIEIGLLTPPVGLNCYVLAGVVPDVSLTDIFKGVAWFLLFNAIATAILVAFPVLSTWLPNTMLK